jgi:glycosyltransferase involved in cell wall biosynthesis
MKVAFDHQIFTIQKFGGISRYFISLVNSLKNKTNAKILVGLYQNEYYQKKYNSVKFKNPSKTVTLNRYLNKASNIIDSKFFAPNILHETYYYNSIPFKGKRITTVYDMIHEKFPNYFLNDSFTSKAKLNSIKRADHVLAISKSTKNDLMEIYNIDEKKITVTYLGVEPFFNYEKTDSIIIDDYFLFVGNRGGYKNFNKVLEAFKQSEKLKEIPLICFGGGILTKGELEIILKFKLKVKHVEGDDNVLKSLYNNAIALIYPSLYEGFGLPVLEAMACGCPVISSNTSSLPEVGGDASIYFDPTNAEELKFKIEDILTSTAVREKYKILGLERVRKFTWQQTALDTYEAYKNLVI